MENKLRAKILCIVLPAVMLAAMLSACSKEDGPAEQMPEQTPETLLPQPDDIQEAPQLHVCACDEPDGTLFAYETAAPGATNSSTPADTLVVGTAPMRGDFIEGWSGNPHDQSIRTLTGGYRDTYRVTADGQIVLNGSAVCNVAAEYDEQWNKTYTFTLHSYLKWSNGESITAADYVAGILAYASPAFAEAGGESSVGEGIVGYREYRYGTQGETHVTDDESTPPATAAFFKGIMLLDEFTFSATIDAAELPYFWETSFVTFRPVYTAGWFPDNSIIGNESGARFAKAIDEDLERISATERFAPTVTCGPYRFASFDGKTVRLERNEHFGVCPEGYVPYFEKIIQMEVSGVSGLNMLRNGELDLMACVDKHSATEPVTPSAPDGNPDGGESGESGETAELVSFVKAHEYPRAGYGFLEFALDFGPVIDYNVRSAISHIISRSMLINEALGGSGVTVDGAYSPAQWTYRARRSEMTKVLAPFFQDIGIANELLDKTVWRYEADGTTPFVAEKAVNSGTYFRHNVSGEVLRIVAASSSGSVGKALEAAAAESAPLAGIEFIVEQIDTRTLLDHYYNGKSLPVSERRWHAFQLATDFTPVDDKYWPYHSALAGTYLNSNGVRDDELDRITMEMRSLDPSQTEEHADLWLEFQLRWQEILPALPLYCNLYCDAYNSIVTQVPTTAFSGYHDVITKIAKHS